MAEQALQSLAAEQRVLITDARKQATNSQLVHHLSNFRKHSRARSAMSLAAAVFGCWSAAVKFRLEQAMLDAMELLQTQVAAFEQELTQSKAWIKELQREVVAPRISLDPDSPLPHSDGALDASDSAFERKLAGMSGMITGKQRDALLTQASETEESERMSDLGAVDLTCLEVLEPRLDAEELFLARRRCADLEINVSELEEERGRLLAQFAESREKCETLRAELAEMTGTFKNQEDGLWEKVLELEVQYKESLQQEQQIREQCSNLQSELFEVQEVASARQQLVVELQRQVKQIHKEKEKLQAETEGRFMDQELRRIETERVHVAQIAAMRDEALPLQHEIMIERQKRTEAEAKLLSVTSERDTLEVAVADSRRNNDELNHQLKYMRNAADGAEEEIEREISRLREARTVELQRNSALEAQLLVLKKEMQGELHARDEESTAAASASEELRTQISNLKSAVKDADKAALTQKGEMQAMIDRLNDQLEISRDAEKVARREARDTKQSLQAQIDELYEEIRLKQGEAQAKRGELLAEIDGLHAQAQVMDELAAQERERLRGAAAGMVATAVAEAVASAQAAAEKKQFERENMLVEVGEEEKRALREEAKAKIEALRAEWVKEKKVRALLARGFARLGVLLLP